MDDANQSTFDIDATTPESLDIPVLPAPSLTLTNIDALMHHPQAMPSGTSWNQKDGRSYDVLLHGDKTDIRVTTDAADFDYSPDNLQLFSPGGQVFEKIEASGKGETLGDGEGICWLAAGECIVRAQEGFRKIDSLTELLAWTEDPGRPGTAPDEAVTPILLA